MVRKGGVLVDVFVSFFIAVMAGVVCHYIIKWLDSDK
ncbi:nitrate reductase [Clostridiaceae bacterium]|nr:nitrate reductase [Clostridiaceae bacterium]RKI14395.1 nitrate reductase [bacterium 1XD21-70]